MQLHQTTVVEYIFHESSMIGVMLMAKHFIFCQHFRSKRIGNGQGYLEYFNEEVERLHLPERRAFLLEDCSNYN